jgi:hypothetical protein
VPEPADLPLMHHFFMDLTAKSTIYHRFFFLCIYHVLYDALLGKMVGLTHKQMDIWPVVQIPYSTIR